MTKYALILLIIMAMGCAKKTVVLETQIKEPVKTVLAEPEPEKVKPPEIGFVEEPFIIGNIHFDYDQWYLRSEDFQTLKNAAVYLLHNPSMSILITGHADQRGGRHYNMALGDKRGWSAAQYLTDMGVSPDQIVVLSYGEEMLLEDCGNDAYPSQEEPCHFKNRRDELQVSE